MYKLVFHLEKDARTQEEHDEIQRKDSVEFSQSLIGNGEPSENDPIDDREVGRPSVRTLELLDRHKGRSPQTSITRTTMTIEQIRNLDDKESP